MRGPLGSKDCPIAAERAWMAQEPAEAWEAYAQPVMTVKCVQDDTVCVCECVRTATKNLWWATARLLRESSQPS